jgi:hypothetical protein
MLFVELLLLEPFNSFVSEVHSQDKDRHTPSCHQAHNVESFHRNARIHKDRHLAQERQHLISEERDVRIVAAREA